MIHHSYVVILFFMYCFIIEFISLIALTFQWILILYYDFTF